MFATVRFSFLTSNDRGYARTKGLSFEERRDVLFGRRRLDRRFDVFEKVCLPSLVAQPSDLFGAVVLASDMLPEPYRSRLSDLLAPFPNLLAAYEAPVPMPYDQLWLKHLERFSDRDDVILTARLDDDDALAANYAADAARYIGPDHVGYCVSFPLGLHVGRINGEIRAWETFCPGLSAGLGFVGDRASGRTINGCGPHLDTARQFPTIHDGRLHQYMVTMHEENDTRFAQGARRFLRRVLDARTGSSSFDRRRPGAETLSLADAASRFGDRFPVLREPDWTFV